MKKQIPIFMIQIKPLVLVHISCFSVHSLCFHGFSFGNCIATWSLSFKSLVFLRLLIIISFNAALFLCLYIIHHGKWRWEHRVIHQKKCSASLNVRYTCMHVNWNDSSQCAIRCGIYLIHQRLKWQANVNPRNVLSHKRPENLEFPWVDSYDFHEFPSCWWKYWNGNTDGNSDEYSSSWQCLNYQQ